MNKEFPPIIKKVGFDFEFDFENDPKTIWELDLPTIEIPIEKLSWHLDIPFWSTFNNFYDLSPKELINKPELSNFHYQKIIKADMKYPIDYTFYKNRNKIIDGLHRLTKAYLDGLPSIKARFIPIEILLKSLETRNKSK